MNVKSVLAVLNSVKMERKIPIFDFTYYINKLYLGTQSYKGCLLIQEGALQDANWSSIGKILHDEFEEDEGYLKWNRTPLETGEAMYAVRMSNTWANKQIYILLHVKPVLSCTKMNLFVLSSFNELYKFLEEYSRNNHIILEPEIKYFLSHYICDTNNYLDTFDYSLNVRE